MCFSLNFECLFSGLSGLFVIFILDERALQQQRHVSSLATNTFVCAVGHDKSNILENIRWICVSS